MDIHLLLASTSTVHGSPYLAYIEDEIQHFFQGKNDLVFIPYARPGGATYDEYTKAAKKVFEKLGFNLRGIHEWDDPKDAINEAEGFFTGGGNTFVLLKTLIDKDLIDPLRSAIINGIPYMGTSAGSNIAGQTISTTNDMPIVYPDSFDALGLVPFNINPHYLDPDPSSKHMGETRETRIKEFHHFNDRAVLGLREGTALEINGDALKVIGEHSIRVFEAGKSPIELSDINELKKHVFSN